MVPLDRLGKRAPLIAGLLLAAGLAWLVVGRWLDEGALPEGLIQANGRIEGDQVFIASKHPGRVEKLLVREGDVAAAGQLLAQLDDAQARARADQARAAVAAARAQWRAAQAKESQARRDAERYRELGAEGTVSRYETEQAELAWAVAGDQLAAAQAQLRNAQAAAAEADSVLADLTIKAPGAGTVSTRMVEGGEVVAAGAPLLSLVDMDRLYLKVYVPEAQIGKLRVGLPAQVYVDAFPDRPFAATLRHIAAQAEFTPKEVQTPDERVKLVYAVKLYLDANPEHRLTPGLPADAVIRWKEDAPWARPRW